MCKNRKGGDLVNHKHKKKINNQGNKTVLKEWMMKWYLKLILLKFQISSEDFSSFYICLGNRKFH